MNNWLFGSSCTAHGMFWLCVRERMQQPLWWTVLQQTSMQTKAYLLIIAHAVPLATILSVLTRKLNQQLEPTLVFLPSSSAFPELFSTSFHMPLFR